MSVISAPLEQCQQHTPHPRIFKGPKYGGFEILPYPNLVVNTKGVLLVLVVGDEDLFFPWLLAFGTFDSMLCLVSNKQKFNLKLNKCC